MKILYTGFNGKNNSSRVLLDNIIGDKLYLKNSYKTSVMQLEEKIKNNEYDLVISFGQAPLDKGIIKIEIRGSDKDHYDTNYDYSDLVKRLNSKFKVVISKNAGNYFCNNIYYYGLKYIYENNLKTKMIFIHIPKMKEIDNILDISNLFKEDLL